MAKGPMQQRIPHDNDAHHMINKKKITTYGDN